MLIVQHEDENMDAKTAAMFTTGILWEMSRMAGDNNIIRITTEVRPGQDITITVVFAPSFGYARQADIFNRLNHEYAVSYVKD